MQGTFIKLFFFLFICVFIKTSIAQKREASGYIIDNDGIIHKGTIQYDRRHDIPATIVFTADAQGVPVEYDISSMQAFGFGNESFVRKDIRYDTRPYDINRLSRSKEPIFAEERVFLKELVSGEVTLYLYIEQLNRDHFFIGHGERIDYLMHSRYIQDALHGSRRETMPYQSVYKATILDYFKDCDMAGVADLQDVSYSRQALSSAIREFSIKCGLMEGELVVKKPQKRYGGLVIGFENSGLDVEKAAFWRSYLYGIETANFGRHTAPYAGVSYAIDFPRWNYRWTLHNELVGTYYSFDAEYTNIDDGLAIDYDASLEFWALKLYVQLQLNHHFSNSRIFFAYGRVGNFRFVLNNEISNNTHRNRDFTINEKFSLGSAITLGYEKNRFQIRLKHELSRAFLCTECDHFTNTSTIGLSLIYRMRPE
jgi:hypothetical protein